MSDQYRSKKSDLSLSSWQPSNIRAVGVSNGFFGLRKTFDTFMPGKEEENVGEKVQDKE